MMRMKIGILGYGGQGEAAYEYWNTPDNQITICDHDEKLQSPDGAKTKLGKNYLDNLDQFDLLIRTPALHPRDIVAANDEKILHKVTTVTNEFFKVCPTKNIIGVTGTKGKGTTSTLIAKMLEASGKRVHLGGNIGIPPLSMLANGIQPDDWVVLELANFQLIDLKHSPHIGICLMVVPEHMDWHDDMNEYVTAKQQMFAHQKSDDIAIYYSENEDSKKIASAGSGKLIPYYKSPGAVVREDSVFIGDVKVVSLSKIKLLGAHNFQNVCAAVTAFWQVSQDQAAVRWVVDTFSGLEHRLELVRELEDIKYYDDSFGTTPETAIVAIEAFEEPKVVILGGSDKGADYKKLALTVKNHKVRKVVTIGKTGPTIAAVLRAEGFEDIVEGGDTMTDIVDTARSNAQAGDIVLLSTGCASFGLFENYKDRGEQFQNVVNALV